MKKIVSYSFRWPVIQVDERTIEVQIPVGNGAPVLSSEPVLSSDFIKQNRLSGLEIDNAETAVLKEVAIIR